MSFGFRIQTKPKQLQYIEYAPLARSRIIRMHHECQLLPSSSAILALLDINITAPNASLIPQGIPFQEDVASSPSPETEQFRVRSLPHLGYHLRRFPWAPPLATSFSLFALKPPIPTPPLSSSSWPRGPDSLAGGFCISRSRPQARSPVYEDSARL